MLYSASVRHYKNVTSLHGPGAQTCGTMLASTVVIEVLGGCPARRRQYSLGHELGVGVWSAVLTRAYRFFGCKFITAVELATTHPGVLGRNHSPRKLRLRQERAAPIKGRSF
jgi:hypothetical protein